MATKLIKALRERMGWKNKNEMVLPVVIGHTSNNDEFMFDLTKTPHLLICGAIVQGKSIAINAIITSLLEKKHPSELQFIMVNPRSSEFTLSNPLMKPYLTNFPKVNSEREVISECDRVINTLNSLVIEMNNRYQLFWDAGVRNLKDYNAMFINNQLNPDKVVGSNLHHVPLPYLVIILDEYADYLMQVGRKLEMLIYQITQRAHAVGMHMIIATNHTSIKVVTIVIQAHIPTRIVLSTQSVIDSRIALGIPGTENLCGPGDMLYSRKGTIIRFGCDFPDHPVYVSKDIDSREIIETCHIDEGRFDPMFAVVARYVVTNQVTSTSRIQRRFEISYHRASKLADQLEAAGIFSMVMGINGRDLLIHDLDSLEQLLHSLDV